MPIASETITVRAWITVVAWGSARPSAENTLLSPRERA